MAVEVYQPIKRCHLVAMDHNHVVHRPYRRANQNTFYFNPIVLEFKQKQGVHLHINEHHARIETSKRESEGARVRGEKRQRKSEM